MSLVLVLLRGMFIAVVVIKLVFRVGSCIDEARMCRVWFLDNVVILFVRLVRRRASISSGILLSFSRFKYCESDLGLGLALIIMVWFVFVPSMAVLFRFML